MNTSHRVFVMRTVPGRPFEHWATTRIPLPETTPGEIVPPVPHKWFRAHVGFVPLDDPGQHRDLIVRHVRAYPLLHVSGRFLVQGQIKGERWAEYRPFNVHHDGNRCEHLIRGNARTLHDRRGSNESLKPTWCISFQVKEVSILSRSETYVVSRHLSLKLLNVV